MLLGWWIHFVAQKLSIDLMPSWYVCRTSFTNCYSAVHIRSHDTATHCCHSARQSDTLLKSVAKTMGSWILLLGAQRTGSEVPRRPNCLICISICSNSMVFQLGENGEAGGYRGGAVFIRHSLKGSVKQSVLLMPHCHRMGQFRSPLVPGTLRDVLFHCRYCPISSSDCQSGAAQNCRDTIINATHWVLSSATEQRNVCASINWR